MLNVYQYISNGMLYILTQRKSTCMLIDHERGGHKVIGDNYLF